MNSLFPRPPSSQARHAKGVNFTELVKVLRVRRRTQPLVGLSAEGEAMLSVRVLASEWYSHEALLDLLRYAYRELLGRSDEAAHQMGIVGGHAVLQGAHRAFISPGNPAASVTNMGVIWKAYFDFGELTNEADGDHACTFRLTGYDDMPSVHGMMIAGWAVAAAQIGGAPSARCEFLEKPWRGAPRFQYRVSF